MTELHRQSAVELLAGYALRAFSPVEVNHSILERIERLDGRLNAFVTVTGEHAIEQARRAEQAWRNGTAGPLEGVPISIKDLTPTRGVRTTRGSLLTADWVPDYDAPFVERVNAAGAVMLGKSNTPELGWKGETSNRVSGTTHNPWKYGKTPGGSSGGGAAAVAMGMGPLAQGSDGAGSIRIPCGFCGIFGLKPSFGLVPQYPPSSVGDVSHLGPMTRTVEDAALLLNVTAGADERDRLSWSSGIDYVEKLKGDLTPLRIAWSPDLGYAAVDPEVAEIARDAAMAFSELGHSVVEAAPDARDPWPVIDVLWSAGLAGAHLNNFAEIRDQLDPGRAAIIERAFHRSAVEVGNASALRNAYVDAVRQFMSGFDLLLTPTLPCAPFDAGLDHPETIGERQMTYLGWTPFTYPFNLTGQPAATVPAGFTKDGLPVGLQIVGRFQDDVTILRAAKAFEAARPWADRWPVDAPFATAG
jgi:aspartyl-tRNA(Asn)/glutamyl-tRNA(Gln) amidotransferase subunit A